MTRLHTSHHWSSGRVQLNLDTTDKIFHIAIGVAAIAAAWVGNKIKIELGEIKLAQSEAKAEHERQQAEVKAELIKQQTETKEDMNRKHQENAQTIAVHAAADEEKFDSIKETQQEMRDTLKEIRQETRDSLRDIDTKLNNMSLNGRKPA